MTLREFLLDSSFVPPLVEYSLAETDGVHHARVAVAGTAYAGTAARFLFRLLSAKSLLFVRSATGRSLLFLSVSQGAPASSREEAKLSAALVALRSLRAESRNEEKKGHQDARPA